MNAAGSGFVYSTYFGTANGEVTPRAIAIDSNHIAYLTGITNAPDFPTASAIQANGGGGLFKTTTGSTSWSTSNTGLRGIQTRDIVIDPTNPAVMYAAGSFNVSGVAKSLDGGATWSPTNLSQTSAPSIVMAPNNSSVLYAGLLNAIAKTTDGGNTWTVSTSGLTNVGFVYSLAIDPTNTSILYMGTTGGGVRKSTDGGASWNAMNNGVTDTFINALVLDKTTPTTLYLGNSTGVSKSTDGGATWTNSSNGLPASSGRFVTALAFAPTTTSTIYASTANFIGTQGGVFKSTNGGGAWTSLVRTDFTMGSIVIDPNNANVIYAPSTANDKLGLSNPASGVGVLKSTDGGVNWTPSGLTSDQVNVLAFNPTNTSTIYAGTTGGYDGFVTALNSTGSGLMYSTYLAEQELSKRTRLQ